MSCAQGESDNDIFYDAKSSEDNSIPVKGYATGCHPNATSTSKPTRPMVRVDDEIFNGMLSLLASLRTLHEVIRHREKYRKMRKECQKSSCHKDDKETVDVEVPISFRALMMDQNDQVVSESQPVNFSYKCKCDVRKHRNSETSLTSTVSVMGIHSYRCDWSGARCLCLQAPPSLGPIDPNNLRVVMGRPYVGTGVMPQRPPPPAFNMANKHVCSQSGSGVSQGPMPCNWMAGNAYCYSRTENAPSRTFQQRPQERFHVTGIQKQRAQQGPCASTENLRRQHQGHASLKKVVQEENNEDPRCLYFCKCFRKDSEASCKVPCANETHKDGESTSEGADTVKSESETKTKYRLAFPQHKDLDLCVPCRFHPSPLINSQGEVFCPRNCGCCLCPWKKPHKPNDADSSTDHNSFIKVCRGCRQRNTIFTESQSRNSMCASSGFDFCPCKVKAEAKHIELYNTEMRDENGELTNPMNLQVALSDVVPLNKNNSEYKNEI